MGTLLVGLVVLAAVIAAIRSLIRDFKTGGCSGCSAAGGGHCGSCHSETKAGIERLIKESRAKHAN